jgi:hypothetical protein
MLNFVLTWTPVTSASATVTNKWDILFVTATTFQLAKDGNFVGTFSTGVAVVQPEITFTVTGSYSVGDAFEFYSYPQSSTDLVITEQSIPAALASDFSITTIGGI